MRLRKKFFQAGGTLRNIRFVHLHVHTQYSFLDGLLTVEEAVGRAKELGMEALAITDRGNLFGALKFYRCARNEGIKPIIGCELEVTDGSDPEAPADRSLNRLVLLAKTNAGYRNLIQLVTRAHLESALGGKLRNPMVCKEWLPSYAEGLIALSGSLTGEIPRLILGGKFDAAKRAALEFEEIFGHGHFYLEVQDHSLPEEKEVNLALVRLGEETGIPLVATNSVRYLDRRDQPLYEAVSALRNRGRAAGAAKAEFYFKSAAEMKQLFTHLPEAVENAARIADECAVTIDLNTGRIPRFPVPPEWSPETFLRNLSFRKLAERYPRATEEVKARLEAELAVVSKRGLADYFLIVQDIVAFARENEIPVGPGRGSAAGSLLAYVLRITDIDPIRYRLCFERFLNPERAVLPDIDIDFCQRRRDEVVQYIAQKYGAGRVAQVAIFSALGARGAIRDAGRSLGMPAEVAGAVAGMVPQFSGKGGIDHALRSLPEFRYLPVHSKPFAALMERGRALEGVLRNVSTHPSAIVISPEPLPEIIPLSTGPRGNVITQYGLDDLEALGLLKIDVLGLRNLTIISDTIKTVRETVGREIDPAQIPLDDPATFETLRNGDTLGCFQLESSGMRRLLRRLKPERMEDLINVLSLYRPGPWDKGSVSAFLKRREGKEPVTFAHPALEDILADTYGIILYQEQVMEIARAVAGFTLADADLLRRSLSKRSSPEGEKRFWRQRFLEGAAERGFPGETAAEIYRMVEGFAGYSFNKSHSAAYAHLSYRTAFLKTHYPVHYFAALLNSRTGYYTPAVYVEEAKHKGIEILPPEVNKSAAGMEVEEGRIRVGLSFVKGLGPRAVSAVIKAREKNGPFASLGDFCARVDSTVVRKAAIENLVKAGAFDFTGRTRREMLRSLETTAGRGRRERNGRTSSLPTPAGEDAIATGPPELRVSESIRERRSMEREVLPFNLGRHPLQAHRAALEAAGVWKTSALRSLEDGTPVSVAGVVASADRRPAGDSRYSLSLLLEDEEGFADVVVPPPVYERNLPEIDPEGIVVRGTLFTKGAGRKIVAREIVSFKKLTWNEVRESLSL